MYDILAFISTWMRSFLSLSSTSRMAFCFDTIVRSPIFAASADNFVAVAILRAIWAFTLARTLSIISF